MCELCFPCPALVGGDSFTPFLLEGSTELRGSLFRTRNICAVRCALWTGSRRVTASRNRGESRLRRPVFPDRFSWTLLLNHSTTCGHRICRSCARGGQGRWRRLPHASLRLVEKKGPCLPWHACCCPESVSPLDDRWTCCLWLEVNVIDSVPLLALPVWVRWNVCE
jgi:hypothetical protein